MKWAWSLFLSVACSVALAAPSSFVYQFRGYPRGADGCDSSASDVASRFANQARVTVLQSVGKKSPTGCTINVSYIAESALRPVSTQSWTETSTDKDLWSFSSLTECQTALSAETKRFRAMVGLPAVIAYCGMDDQHPLAGIVMRMEAYGKPNMVPTAWVLPEVYGDFATYSANVEQAITSLGGVIFRKGYGTGDRPRANTIHFYKPRVNIGLWNLSSAPDNLTFDTPEECAAQKPEAEKTVAAFGATLVASSCAHPSFSRETTLFVTYSAQSGPVPIRVETPELDYPSAMECMKDRDRVVKIYQDVLKKDVRGSMCTYADYLVGHRYVMKLFEH